MPTFAVANTAADPWGEWGLTAQCAAKIREDDAGRMKVFSL
jgi:hypothetical protein